MTNVSRLTFASPDHPRPWAGAAVMALVLFFFTLVLDTRHNNFPFSYHPDEGGKVIQVIAGSRNYHHPLLLLQTTEYVAKLAFIPHTPQAIVETGRWVSAAFAAGAVAAFSLIGWWNYGLLIGWGAGLAVALQRDLFELAHYMKEDTALLFGLALALFAAHVWWRRPSRRSLTFLAITCALAVAGKYLGIVALAFALPIVFWHRTADATLPRGARLKRFAAFFLATFLVCNLPIFGWQISSPFRSIGHEVNGVAGGHLGLSRKVPHAEYLHALKSEIPPTLAVLAAVYAVALGVTPRRRTPAEWITLLFPIAYLAMISCSPKISGRYLLPVNAMIPLLAAVGAGEVGRWISFGGSRAGRIFGGLIAACLLVVLIRSEMPTFSQFYDVVAERQTADAGTALFSRAYIGFQHDDPANVAKWITNNLPATAIIAEDHRVNLSSSKADGPSANARVPQKVLDAAFAPDLGTLEELRAKGVEYVALCHQTYGRYFDEGIRPRAGVKSSYDKKRDFYARVIHDGQLLKEWPKGSNTYLQPGIQLYRIPPEKVAP